MKHFTKKCRMTSIIRKVKELREENGKLVEKTLVKEFPVKVNKGVPFSHKMLK